MRVVHVHSDCITTHTNAALSRTDIYACASRGTLRNQRTEVPHPDGARERNDRSAVDRSTFVCMFVRSHVLSSLSHSSTLSTAFLSLLSPGGHVVVEFYSRDGVSSANMIAGCPLFSRSCSEHACMKKVSALRIPSVTQLVRTWREKSKI